MLLPSKFPNNRPSSFVPQRKVFDHLQSVQFKETGADDSPKTSTRNRRVRNDSPFVILEYQLRIPAARHLHYLSVISTHASERTREKLTSLVNHFDATTAITRIARSHHLCARTFVRHRTASRQLRTRTAFECSTTCPITSAQSRIESSKWTDRRVDHNRKRHRISIYSWSKYRLDCPRMILCVDRGRSRKFWRFRSFRERLF